MRASGASAHAGPTWSQASNRSALQLDSKKSIPLHQGPCQTQITPAPELTTVSRLAGLAVWPNEWGTARRGWDRCSGWSTTVRRHSGVSWRGECWKAPASVRWPSAALWRQLMTARKDLAWVHSPDKSSKSQEWHQYRNLNSKMARTWDIWECQDTALECGQGWSMESPHPGEEALCAPCSASPTQQQARWRGVPRCPLLTPQKLTL